MSLLDGKRVLVVEDEYFLANELTEAIQTAGGFVVGPFAKASEAKQALIEGVDLAVLNVRVRDGVTYPLAEQLRGLGIPFVFASGQANDTEPEEWRTSSWIAKPYHPSAVVEWLLKAFEAK